MCSCMRVDLAAQTETLNAKCTHNLEFEVEKFNDFLTGTKLRLAYDEAGFKSKDSVKD